MADIIKFDSKKEKLKTNENEERINKIKEAIKKLPGYRGEVITKNNIRNLPEVKAGDIFWVASEKKTYLVSDKQGKKTTLKALDEMATVSTGITIFEMNKSIVSKEPLWDKFNRENWNEMAAKVTEWFKNTKNKFYLMYGRDIHYVTILNVKTDMNMFGGDDIDIIINTLENIGDIISFDFETDRIEVWLRTKDSLAELIYIMPYDAGVVPLTSPQ